MDAFTKLSQTALLVTAALSLAASANAQSLQVTPNSSTTPVPLLSGGTQFSVSGGTAPYFETITASNPGSPSSAWFWTSAVSASGTFSAYATNADGCALTSTQCTGTIAVSDSNGNTVNVNVTNRNTGGSTQSSLVANPPTVLISYPPTSYETYYQQVSVTTNNSTQESFTATPSTGTGVPWLTVNNSNGTTPATLTLALNSAYFSTLATGTYYGTVTLQNTAAPSDSTVIHVTLTINGGIGTGTGLFQAPPSPVFTCESTTCAQVVQGVLVQSLPAGAEFGATYDTGFPNNCAVSGSSSGSNLILLTANCTPPVTAGTYGGIVTVTDALGNTDYAIPFTLGVTSGTPTLLPFASSAASFGQSVTCIANNGTCSPTTLQLYSSDGQTQNPTTLTVNSVTSPDTWITLSNSCTGPTPISNCTVNINPAGLPNGLNNGAITVAWSNDSTSGSPLTIPVAVLVSGSSTTSSPLTFSPSSLSFSSANSSPQTVTVFSQSSTSFTATPAFGTCSAGWFSLSATSGTANLSGYVVQVSVNASAGTCSGSISFTPSGGSAQTYNVYLTSGSVTLSQTVLSFMATAGGSATQPQAVVVSSPSNASGVSFTYSTTEPWLLATTSSTGPGTTSGQGTAQTNLYISVNPANLSAGTYQGTVNVGGTPVTVNLTVSAASSVSATSTSLNFTYTAGNGNATPSSATVTVTGTPGAQFSAVATSNGNWLALSPTSGTVPSSGSTTLAVSLQNLSTQTASSTPYTGTITVTGTNGAIGSTTLNASLTVTAPLPTILSVTSAASFNSGPISAGEIITIFGTQLGPATGVALASSNITNNTLPTQLGGVSVTVGGYPASMLYASAGQVSAIVPYEIDQAPVFLASPTVIVKYLGQTSNGISERQVAAEPGIFTANASGSGPGAILNSDSSFNCACSTGRPAQKGETVVLYLTGEGQTLPAGKTGSFNPSTPPFPQPVQAPTVTINGQPAQVVFYGEAPTLVAGVLQINVVIPQTAMSGANPVVVSFGNSYSQMTSAGQGAVTVAVQ